MSKTLTLAFTLVAVIACQSMAGTLYLGDGDQFREKTQAFDGQHEKLGVPNPQEADACIDIAPSDVFVDGLGSPNNSVYSVDLAAAVGAAGAVLVTDIGWDVTIDPVGDSWYSEASFNFSNDVEPPILGALNLAPGSADGFPNDGAPKTYSSGGLVNLVDTAGGNLALITGVLRLELFESFDDVVDATDSFLLTGSTLDLAFTDLATGEAHTATLKWVPEPASFSLLSLAGLALLGFRRK